MAAEPDVSTAAPPPAVETRWVGTWPGVLLVGAGLGVFAWWADVLLAQPEAPAVAGLIGGLGNVPSVWALLAFWVGASGSSIGGAAVRATVCLGVAVGAYYLVSTLSGARTGVQVLPATTVWLGVAMVAGPVFGGAGAGWRLRPGRLAGWSVALLAGVLVAEAWMLAAELLPYRGVDLSERTFQVAALDLIVALALPFLLLRRAADRRVALVGMPLVAAAGIVGLEALAAVLRLVRG